MFKFNKKIAENAIKKAVFKGIVMLALTLLWDKFINIQKLMNVVGHAFFVFGVFFLMLAWFNYLALDGVNLLKPIKEMISLLKKRRKEKAIRDTVDHILETEPGDELDETDAALSSFYANLVVGLKLVIISSLYWVLN